MKIIILIDRPLTAVGLYRIYYQYKHLTTDNIKLLSIHENINIDFTGIDRVILHYSLCTKEIIDRFYNIGVEVVLDIDDSFNLPEEHYLHNSYKENKRKEELIHCISKCKTITCITVPLRDELLQYHDEVIVLPNFIPQQTIQEIEELPNIPNTTGKLRIGYLGGLCHKHDLEIIRGFNQLLEKNFKDKYELHLFGFIKNQEYLDIDKLITSNGRYYRNFYKHNMVNLEQYYSLYKYIDVSIAPLVYDRFNACKSNLKFIEATYSNVPLIASNVYPYSDSCGNNTLRLCDDKFEFIEAIDDLMKKSERRLLVDNARTYLNKLNQQEINKQLIKKYILP